LTSATIRQSSFAFASAPVRHSLPSTCDGGACETLVPSRLPSPPPRPPPPESALSSSQTTIPTTPSPPPPTVSPPPGIPKPPRPRVSSICEVSSGASFR
jgi:hypothetical protein